MKTKLNILSFCIFVSSFSFFSCQKKIDQVESSVSGQDAAVKDLSLYIASGACNSGQGITTYAAATASKLITEHDMVSGELKHVILDYNLLGDFAVATTPQTLINVGNNLIVENENATAAIRNIIVVPKNQPETFSNYYANATAFSGVMRGMALDASGNIYVGKTTAIEKINTTPTRVLASGNPWVNNPQGSCVGSNTSISSVLTLPASFTTSSRVIYAHQGATAATNRLGIISQNGYNAAGDCLAGVQISAVTHTKASNLTSETVTFNTNGTAPTSMIYIPVSSMTATGKLLVSYANAQTTNYPSGVFTMNHGIALWDVKETSGTATLSNPKVLFDDATVLFGISAMAYDAEHGYLYVATGSEPGVTNFTTNAAGYNIERFSLDLSSESDPKLTRITTNNQPYYLGSAFTRCISGMTIGHTSQ